MVAKEGPAKIFLASAIFSHRVDATFSPLCEVLRSVAYSGRRTSF
jgi:hypothetical protein